MTNPSSPDISDTSRQELLTLADWLLHMRVQNETSVCANDPVIRQHIAKLKHWEDILRAPSDAQAQGYNFVTGERDNQETDDTYFHTAQAPPDDVDSDALWALISEFHSNVPADPE